MRRITSNRLLILVVFGLALAFGPGLGASAEPDEPENVRIKLLTPDDAAAGLRVFGDAGPEPMDRERMGALMNRALDDLKRPDGVIESASGNSVTIRLSSGQSESLDYDAASHSWSGTVYVVVLPQ